MFTHKSNIETTLNWMYEHEYDTYYGKSDKELESLADVFCSWEEKEMPKDNDGAPDWSMVIEYVKGDETYVLVNYDSESRVACDWAECLEVFVETGNLPEVVTEN